MDAATPTEALLRLLRLPSSVEALGEQGAAAEVNLRRVAAVLMCQLERMAALRFPDILGSPAGALSASDVRPESLSKGHEANRRLPGEAAGVESHVTLYPVREASHEEPAGLLVDSAFRLRFPTEVDVKKVTSSHQALYILSQQGALFVWDFNQKDPVRSL